MRLAFLVIVCPVLAVSCGPKDDPALVEAAKTPLAFDPTEQYEMPVWWSNGQELLYLDQTGYYELYSNLNRYQPPRERGLWGRQNFAALWLEPYEQLQTERVRVPIRKVNDDFVLDLDSVEPMLAVKGPPTVLEDRLIGRWFGSTGTLQLGSDLRYVFQPQRELPPEPATLAGQSGHWLVNDQTLELRPDSPGVESSRLIIRDVDDAIVLESAVGVLVKKLES